jgi:hypothetical protein
MAAALIRLTWATSRVTWIRREVMDEAAREGRHLIMAFWHSRLLLMQYMHGGRPLAAMISRHGDGELIARTMARFGHSAVRGSSTRGGSRALREALRWTQSGGNLAITPDGPRGPARVAKPGVVDLARLTGLPVYPMSLAAARAAHLRSWDRFEVPLPFGRVALAYGAPLTCPRDAGPDRVLALAAELARRLDALTDECRLALGLPAWPAAPAQATSVAEAVTSP